MGFFERYRRTMRLTYLAVVIVSVVLFATQMRTQYRNRTRLMDERFRQMAVSLDFFAKGIADHVQVMRVTAERSWRDETAHQGNSRLLAAVADRPDGQGFALDRVPAPFKGVDTGNPTGAGSSRGRSPDFYSGMRVAFSLGPLFRASTENLPNMAWAYYTSRDAFILMYPWVPWKDYHYSGITHTGDFYALGLPEVNRERKRFWTGVYVDQCGKGLMVTCGAPVYHQDRFMGTVAGDATLDALNTYLSQFPYRGSTLMLANERGELLAYPGIVHSSDKQITLLAKAPIVRGALTPARLATLKPDEEHLIDGQVVVCHAFENAPWRVYMVTRRATILAGVASETAPPLVLLFIGMTAMLLVANNLTRREFIQPAQNLVSHIDALGRDPATPIPPAPAAWRVWFETVSTVFRQNAGFLEQLREQNENLERTVEQRTAEVSHRNEELAEAMDRLKEMQRQIVTQEKMAALGGLTAGIAHEIKNPLNFVINFSELSNGLLDETEQVLEGNAAQIEKRDMEDLRDLLSDLRTNVAKISEHGKRADSIVRGMLLHSRGKSGQRQLTDINALVGEYVNLAYHGLRAVDTDFNVKLETSFDPEAGRLSVVPQDLSRAILNIVNNACYAANDARRTRGSGFNPTVWITTKALPEQIEVRIRDNGCGIPEEVREKVFAPFYTTKPTGKGTGLGLSITYDIVVQQHRGTLTIDSAPDEFTEFIMRLPRTTDEEETQA